MHVSSPLQPLKYHCFKRKYKHTLFETPWRRFRQMFFCLEGRDRETCNF